MAREDNVLTLEQLYDKLERQCVYGSRGRIKYRVRFKDSDSKWYLFSDGSSLPISDGSGEIAWNLHSTYGFPVDMTRDLLIEKGYALEEEEFQMKYNDQIIHEIKMLNAKKK